MQPVQKKQIECLELDSSANELNGGGGGGDYEGSSDSLMDELHNEIGD
jgi:hypothetical protein